MFLLPPHQRCVRVRTGAAYHAGVLDVRVKTMHSKAAEAIVERLTFVAQNLLYPPGLPLAGQKILDIRFFGHNQ